MMRVAVLWSKMSGYLNSCLRELAQTQGIELFVSYEAATADAPFADDLFQWFPDSYRSNGESNAQVLLPRLRHFNPDLLIVATWVHPAYRAACHEFREKAVRICCFDNQWAAEPKQWLGVATAPLFMQRLYDGVFVAGERQAQFARKLGFGQDRIWRGSLSCDHESFAEAYQERRMRSAVLPESFLYVGRLSPEKGVDVLIEGYQMYRSQSASPWPLIVSGALPSEGRFQNVEGVHFSGFVQPTELPGSFSQAGCFVLPSIWEPWGVVIHEACSAGVPVICTSSCGASVHLVQDGFNGLIVEPGSAASLARAFKQFASLSVEQRTAMGEASYQLSLQFTPQRWASTVCQRGKEMMEEKLAQRD